MRYDDELLEQALAALPLEETPPGLRARILAATIYRPAPAFRTWELWVVGAALAVATWLIFALTGSALTGGPGVALTLQSASDRAVQAFLSALTPSSLLWLGIGLSAAVWFTQLNFPGRGEGSGA